MIDTIEIKCLDIGRLLSRDLPEVWHDVRVFRVNPNKTSIIIRTGKKEHGREEMQVFPIGLPCGKITEIVAKAWRGGCQCDTEEVWSGNNGS